MSSYAPAFFFFFLSSESSIMIGNFQIFQLPKTCALGLVCYTKDRFTPSPKSQVPSPTHVSKSQHGDKVPIFEPQESISIWLIIIKFRSWLFYAKIFTDVIWELGLTFCLTQLSTQDMSLTFKKCCHVDIHVMHGTWEFEHNNYMDIYI